MSGLYSMPTDRAPRLAAVITVRPSPEPRSMWKSCGVSLARSSIFSTSGWGVGTQTTSLPAWPTVGSKGLAGVCVCARAGTARLTRATTARARRVSEATVMSKLYVGHRPGLYPPLPAHDAAPIFGATGLRDARHVASAASRGRPPAELDRDAVDREDQLVPGAGHCSHSCPPGLKASWSHVPPHQTRPQRPVRVRERQEAQELLRGQGGHAALDVDVRGCSPCWSGRPSSAPWPPGSFPTASRRR